MGLRLQDIARPAIPVWPDVWPALNLFNSLRTQWRMGFAGASGLDYSAIEPAMRLQGIPPEDWPDLFADLRVMEQAALEIIHQKVPGQ